MNVYRVFHESLSLRAPRLKLHGLALLLAAALTLPAPVAGAADTLIPHTARYKIKISIASGTLETKVRESAAGFDVHSVIRPTGIARLLTSGTIEESSQFDLDADGVRPREYASRDTLSRDKKAMDFAFDWETNEVNGTINDEAFHFELPDEAHDRVSIQYQLMHNLLTGTNSKNYAMLDGDELKLLNITTLENREIKVPFGTFDAIGIRHQAANSKRITTLWCAEELGYLPVLIEQHRKGKRRVHAVLTDYREGTAGDTALGSAN